MLPPNWELCECKNYPSLGYYYNSVTEESTWIYPSADSSGFPSPDVPIYLQQILIKYKDSINARTERELKRSFEDAQNLINIIHRRVTERPELFDKLANDNSAYSKDGSAGHIGWVYPDEVPPVFKRKAWSLKINQISPVFDTPLGFHILLRRG